MFQPHLSVSSDNFPRKLRGNFTYYYTALLMGQGSYLCWYSSKSNENIFGIIVMIDGIKHKNTKV
jgi:hypothetical protein